MTTTVERSAGSRSMYQVNASLAPMYSMPVVFTFPTVGPYLVRGQGHWSVAIRPAGPPLAGRRSLRAPLPTVREGPVLERAAADRGVQDLGGVRDRDVLAAPGQGGCDLQ